MDYQIKDKNGEVVSLMVHHRMVNKFSTKTFAEWCLRRYLGKKWEERCDFYTIEVIDA